MEKKTFSNSTWFKVLLLSLLTLHLVGCQQMMTGLLNPKGLIAYKERQLFFDSLALMLIVVIPVFIMSFAFVTRYRANHNKSEYAPNWSHSTLLEIICWGVPCIIIIVLGVMTWVSSHKLDPYRRIDVPGKPLLIQAIALPWKWLFIYPEQKIATVNFLEIAKGQQVEFWFTNDNVAMSAFFIPQLGSQIYTMAGMRTRLHLLAFEEGIFKGLDTQYNGAGFSDMHFRVKVVDSSSLEKWFAKVKKLNKPLTQAKYKTLHQPSIKEPVHYFSAVNSDLFTRTIGKYKLTGDTFSY